MANQLSKFGMLEFQSWRGLTKENHLGAMYSLAPQKATEKMVQLLATYRGKTLEDYLKQFPIKYFDDDNDYTWQVSLNCLCA